MNLKILFQNSDSTGLEYFAYSHEEGTYSYNNYKDDISEKVKESRVAELMEIQQSISE